LRDHLVFHARGSRQHNPRPPRQSLRGSPAVRQPLQFGPLLSRQLDCDRRFSPWIIPHNPTDDNHTNFSIRTLDDWLWKITPLIVSIRDRVLILAPAPGFGVMGIEEVGRYFLGQAFPALAQPLSPLYRSGLPPPGGRLVAWQAGPGPSGSIRTA
jgi:hypothetical protein